MKMTETEAFVREWVTASRADDVALTIGDSTVNSTGSFTAR